MGRKFASLCKNLQRKKEEYTLQLNKILKDTKTNNCEKTKLKAELLNSVSQSQDADDDVVNIFERYNVNYTIPDFTTEMNNISIDKISLISILYVSIL